MKFNQLFLQYIDENQEKLDRKRINVNEEKNLRRKKSKLETISRLQRRISLAKEFLKKHKRHSNVSAKNECIRIIDKAITGFGKIIKNVSTDKEERSKCQVRQNLLREIKNTNFRSPSSDSGRYSSKSSRGKKNSSDSKRAKSVPKKQSRSQTKNNGRRGKKAKSMSKSMERNRRQSPKAKKTLKTKPIEIVPYPGFWEDKRRAQLQRVENRRQRIAESKRRSRSSPKQQIRSPKKQPIRKNVQQIRKKGNNKQNEQKVIWNLQKIVQSHLQFLQKLGNPNLQPKILALKNLNNPNKKLNEIRGKKACEEKIEELIESHIKQIKEMENNGETEKIQRKSVTLKVLVQIKTKLFKKGQGANNKKRNQSPSQTIKKRSRSRPRDKYTPRDVFRPHEILKEMQNAQIQIDNTESFSDLYQLMEKFENLQHDLHTAIQIKKAVHHMKKKKKSEKPKKKVRSKSPYKQKVRSKSPGAAYKHKTRDINNPKKIAKEMTEIIKKARKATSEKELHYLRDKFSHLRHDIEAAIARKKSRKFVKDGQKKKSPSKNQRGTKLNKKTRKYCNDINNIFFQTCDKKNVGLLDKKHVYEFLEQQYYESYSKAKIKNMLKEIQTNHPNQITKKEGLKFFIRYMAETKN